ncbi:MAG TPA: nuclease-related domain-containing protein [Spirochaetota bacterium]|jgi:hypothetical protein|nr:MAG: hypothetical protein BWY23_01323 [Spirochaetes bacterium ADurb.Bin218]HOK01857.1 nuclease-related domain-containing protein [Spirochaetota bacterium]HOK91953.1 nuclease-related domain-containing protein [Spirochaetota bacterium]HON15090.1 nuclease-related domain-containing protein [Spirochaetota bacterium]HOQ11047.1 nuclease-related domain-containing protein [Spirochaetota bacterium]
MAYIEGNPEEKIAKTFPKHLSFIAITTFALFGFLLVSSQNLTKDLYGIAIITLVALSLMIFVSFRINPLAWKKVVNKNKFQWLLSNENKTIETLSQLNDDYFILNDFTFELFHVEHLVISKHGIFVIAKSPAEGKIEIIEDSLYISDYSLESVTARLWRLCHLIKIIIGKGFDGYECMPKPILLLAHEEKSNIKDFNEISICGLSELNKRITTELTFPVKSEIAEGFAIFMKQRYMRG